MCDQHQFEFDVDKAYADQLTAALQASPAHLLGSAEAPESIGVYALYRANILTPAYIGVATSAAGIRGRLREHLRKIEGRVGIDVAEMTCRYLVLGHVWEAARAEETLIAHYQPEWNRVTGFGMHPPGRGRPGLPGYANEWDRMFPPR